jgi:excisionase family DNA binding protein
MEYVNAAQAATMIGVSERTIRRWIAGGKLPARHLGPNRYAITTSNIDTLVRTFKPTDEPPDDRDILLARLEVLERRLHTVSQRLTNLEREDSQSSLNIGASFECQNHHRTFNGPVILNKSDALPPGSMRMCLFARSHGISRFKLQSLAEEGEIAHTAINRNARNGSMERWLTPEQQAGVIAFWLANGIRYTHCPHCPHCPQEDSMDLTPTNLTPTRDVTTFHS